MEGKTGRWEMELNLMKIKSKNLRLKFDYVVPRPLKIVFQQKELEDLERTNLDLEKLNTALMKETRV